MPNVITLPALAFTEPVDELAEERNQPIPQNLANRAIFSLHQRPAAGGMLNWQNSAATLDALVRALDFGPYPNPLGLPKMALPDEFVLVSHRRLWRAASAAPAKFWRLPPTRLR
ncbi:MAG: hypothetical protein U0401_13535 [Anaerolineae bacterium]